MKLNKTLAISAVAMTIAAAPLIAQEAETATQEPVEMELLQPSIAFAAAVQTASSSAQGNIVSMELAYADDKPFYTAALETDTSFSMLLIDGITGEVIASNVTQAANEDALSLLLALSEMGEGEFDEYDEYEMHDAEYDMEEGEPDAEMTEEG